MIGNSMARAYDAMSFSEQYASGRITMCWPSSVDSLGGIAFILPPKNMFRKKVWTMSSRWWPSAILLAPSSLAVR
ncbi:hypothetical protein D9M72_429010 [compost metagenome]